MGIPWYRWFGAAMLLAGMGGIEYMAFGAPAVGLGARVGLAVLGLLVGGGGAASVLLLARKL